jgi:hypothetical protein
VKRRHDGRVADPESAKVLGRKGGLAKAANGDRAALFASRLSLTRHLEELGANEYLAPVVRESAAWLTKTATDLASEVGGGKLDAISGTMLELAAWQRAYALYFFSAASKTPWTWDRQGEDAKPPVRPHTKLVEVANRLTEGFRTTAIAAFDIAAKTAKARPPDRDALPPGFQWVDEPEKKP